MLLYYHNMNNSRKRQYSKETVSQHTVNHIGNFMLVYRTTKTPISRQQTCSSVLSYGTDALSAATHRVQYHMFYETDTILLPMTSSTVRCCYLLWTCHGIHNSV